MEELSMDEIFQVTRYLFSHDHATSTSDTRQLRQTNKTYAYKYTKNLPRDERATSAMYTALEKDWLCRAECTWCAR